tara:strand:- start:1492 stop:1659 length:168 start_codon:yes stop_codon:yes gene_type:complete
LSDYLTAKTYFNRLASNGMPIAVTILEDYESIKTNYNEFTAARYIRDVFVESANV